MKPAMFWGTSKIIFDTRGLLCYNGEQSSIMSPNNEIVPFGRTAHEIVEESIPNGTPVKEDRFCPARD